MQRWTSVLFGLLFAAAVVAVVLKAQSPAEVAAEPTVDSAAGDAAVAKADSAPTPADGGSDAKQSARGPDFLTLPDGAPIPELPRSAPRRVKLAIILFTYKGAEFAPKDARSKQDARAKALATLAEAREDFDEAVKRGDPGSSANAGAIPRGILEPAVEYVVFTLDKGQVYEAPLDTPRGYWIVKRTK